MVELVPVALLRLKVNSKVESCVTFSRQKRLRSLRSVLIEAVATTTEFFLREMVMLSARVLASDIAKSTVLSYFTQNLANVFPH